MWNKLQSWFLRFVVRVHVSAYRLSRGKILGKWRGFNVILLTTVGRKSGQERTVPVLGFKDNDSYAVIGANIGRDEPPAWRLNLESNPEAKVQVGSKKLKVKAKKATPAQRNRAWQKAKQAFRGYEYFQKRTKRKFPVLILSPVRRADVT